MEKQKKWRFNIIDVLFLLVVLAGILFVILRLGGFDVVARITGTASTEQYVVAFTSNEVPDYVAERIQAGDKVTDENLSVNLGTVVDVQLAPAQVPTPDAQGKLVISEEEGFCSVLLSCRVTASDNGNGVTADGLDLGVGHTMVVRAGDAKMYMVLCDIQKLADSPYAQTAEG